MVTLLCVAPFIYGVMSRGKSRVAELYIEDGVIWANYATTQINKYRNIEKRTVLSPYDSLFKEVSQKYGNDWLFLCAIASVESHFKSDVSSRVGARGLMQIMPSTASIFGIHRSDLYDPRISIDVASRYLIEIERMLMLPDSIGHHDFLSLTLAAYNGGIGRVYDAQRLARSAGDDPYKWSELKWHLLSLRKEEVYTRPEVRYGHFKGPRKTLAYVENVMKKYDEYQAAVEYSTYHLLPISRY